MKELKTKDGQAQWTTSADAAWAACRDDAGEESTGLSVRIVRR
jgi:hypothetical protein